MAKEFLYFFSFSNSFAFSILGIMCSPRIMLLNEVYPYIQFSNILNILVDILVDYSYISDSKMLISLFFNKNSSFISSSVVDSFMPPDSNIQALYLGLFLLKMSMVFLRCLKFSWKVDLDAIFVFLFFYFAYIIFIFQRLNYYYSNLFIKNLLKLLIFICLAF